MTIQKRLDKLELMGLLLTGGYHLDFIDWCKQYNIYLISTSWWKFSRHGNKKHNLIVANKFWEYIYNNYKEGKLSDLYVSAHIKSIIRIIQQLEKGIKK